MNGPAAIPVIIGVVPGKEYRLTLHFADGHSGEVDIAAVIPFAGVFAPLQDRDCFARVTVNAVSGTISWPNGADLDPVVLHAATTGCPIEWRNLSTVPAAGIPASAPSAPVAPGAPGTPRKLVR